MKKNRFKYNIVLFFMIVILGACNYDLGDNIYTKKLDMIGEYLNNNPKHFSEFYKVLEKTDMLGALNSYGNYTCFAPNNEAVSKFFADSEYGSLEKFPLDSLKKIVLYQLIEDDTIVSSDFTTARLRTGNMAGNDLQVKYSDVDGSIIINNMATLLVKDLKANNGIIHMTNAFILPDAYNVTLKLKDSIYDGRFSIFSKALHITGLDMLMQASEDTTIFSYINTKKATVVIPRKFRYTILAESDTVYKQAGIMNVEDLKMKCDSLYGPNGLKEFIGYHCLDRLYDESDFILFAKQDGYEAVETMNENTLLEFRKYPEGVVFDRFTDRYTKAVINTGSTMTSNSKYKNIMGNNGMIHEINQILYIPDMSVCFAKKTRFNVCSFLPELMNSGCRGKKNLELPDASLGGPQFYKNMTIIGEAGKVIPFYDYTTTWIRHQFDEILIGMGWSAWDQSSDPNVYANTRYDVKLTLPPIPAGKWEIRFGFTSNGNRGMAQLYFDGEPSGVPLLIGIGENYGIDGMDESTARKVMYNNAFMPFPSHIKDGWGASAAYNRTDRVRRIIGTFTFSEMKKHVLRFKTVEPGQLSLNFIEFIPVDQIADEGTD
jgi:uncharacterized surface protein with fasciclin (FAS1) repeats